MPRQSVSCSLLQLILLAGVAAWNVPARAQIPSAPPGFVVNMVDSFLPPNTYAIAVAPASFRNVRRSYERSVAMCPSSSHTRRAGFVGESNPAYDRAVDIDDKDLRLAREHPRGTERRTLLPFRRLFIVATARQG